MTSVESEFPTLSGNTNLRVKTSGDFEYIMSSWSNGIITNDVLNFEYRQVYRLTIRVTDIGKLTHETEIAIIVRDVNEPPVFPPVPTLKVYENVVSGDKIGIPISVHDDEFGISSSRMPSYTYSLVNDEKGKFNIDATSGEIY